MRLFRYAPETHSGKLFTMFYERIRKKSKINMYTWFRQKRTSSLIPVENLRLRTTHTRTHRMFFQFNIKQIVVFFWFFFYGLQFLAKYCRRAYKSDWRWWTARAKCVRTTPKMTFTFIFFSLKLFYYHLHMADGFGDCMQWRFETNDEKKETFYFILFYFFFTTCGWWYTAAI